MTKNNHQMTFTIPLSVLLQYGEISRHFLSELGALFLWFPETGRFSFKLLLGYFFNSILTLPAQWDVGHNEFFQNYEIGFFPLLALKNLLYFKEHYNRPLFLKFCS